MGDDSARGMRSISDMARFTVSYAGKGRWPSLAAVGPSWREGGESGVICRFEGWLSGSPPACGGRVFHHAHEFSPAADALVFQLQAQAEQMSQGHVVLPAERNGMAGLAIEVLPRIVTPPMTAAHGLKPQMPQRLRQMLGRNRFHGWVPPVQEGGPAMIFSRRWHSEWLINMFS